MNTPTRDGLLSLASLSQGGAELVQACLHQLYTPADLEWLYRHGWTPQAHTVVKAATRAKP
ncbi:MAG TPA: hypothetical protein VFU40_07070 [Gemmatimonadales bacterium]|nr:hypothetical protein [Gemmatimonadales bacterium]